MSNALDLAIAKHVAARVATDAAERQGETEDEIARLFTKELELLEAICEAPCPDDRQFFATALYVVGCLQRDYDFSADVDGAHDGLLKRLLLTHLTGRRESKKIPATTGARPGARKNAPTVDVTAGRFYI